MFGVEAVGFQAHDFVFRVSVCISGVSFKILDFGLSIRVSDFNLRGSDLGETFWNIILRVSAVRWSVRLSCTNISSSTCVQVSGFAD